MQQTISILASRVGTKLQGIEYRCFPVGCDEVAEPLFALGGEVCLHFGACDAMYVTWFHDEVAEWQADYVIAAFLESAFNEDAIRAVYVSDTPLWKNLVDAELQGVDILGWMGAPSILEFKLGGERVYICSGIQWEKPGAIGDGDWVLIRSEEEF